MTEIPKEIKTGTTTVGIRTSNAVVLAADKRATMGHIAYDEDTRKVYKVTDSMAMTIAGSVADAFTLIRFLRSQAQLYELERGTVMNVRAASTLLSNVLNGNRFYPYLVQLILGGYDSNGSQMYELSPVGGGMERTKYAVSGSGTELALTVLDENYRESMTEDETIQLAIRAVKAAKKRDIYSGGVDATITLIDSKGVKELTQEEVQKQIKGMEKTVKSNNNS